MMMVPLQRTSMLKLFFGLGVFWCLSIGAEDRIYSFERGTQHDLENGIVIKDAKPKHEEKSSKRSERERKSNARAVGSHIRNLRSTDIKIRENSAEMLGLLNAKAAIPGLIDALRDNQEHLFVQLKAHGALNKITGMNFGYKNHRRWASWWQANREEFIKKAKMGPSQLGEIGAKTANTLGLSYLNSGQYVLARGQFLEAVNKDPRIPDYRNNLGLAVMELGDYISAIVYFEETIGLNENLPQPYMNIGSSYARMNKHIEAQHWFRRAMKRDKDGRLWEPLWTLGKEYLKKGEFDMAKEFLEQASEKASRRRIYDPRIYRDLALTYYGLDMYHSSWWAIKQVWKDGYELDKGFITKVRNALKAQGIDPEAIKKRREREE